MNNIPPFSSPPPPPDPRAQYRAYHEQQRAAWRAQRQAWKANYAGVPTIPSIVGPVILIGVGVVALLIAAGRLSPLVFWSWYAHWWPLLLIGAGLALLGEWFLDLRRNIPVRRRGSFIGVMLLLGVVGLFAAGWAHSGQPLRMDFGDHDFSFFNGFDRNEFSTEQDVFNQTIAANAVVNVQNPNGDVNVVVGDGANFQVHARAIAFGESEDQAKPIWKTVLPQVTVSGNTVVVRSEGDRHGRVNLTLSVPRGSHLSITAGKGNVTVAQITGGLDVTASHGDVHLSSLAGSVNVHAAPGGEFSIQGLAGDLDVEGACNDFTLADVKGRVTLNCDFFDRLHIEHVSGPLHLHTAKTDIQVAELTGTMNLNDDSLQLIEARGAVRVATQARDVELSDISGDCSVSDRDGGIDVALVGSYNLDVRNGNGNVVVTLPPNAAGIVEGTTHNGEIATDFPLSISGDTNKTVRGTIGRGGHKIALSVNNGDLHIKRGSSAPPLSKPSELPKPPRSNSAVPHLKAPAGESAKPVTQ